jgi:predicted DNA repair protein MutK
VVWAVAKGSLLNKAILVPAALLLSAFAPWAIKPLLMIGGAFLCYEGVEKLWHKLLPRARGGRASCRAREGRGRRTVDLVRSKRTRSEARVRTDFILSAEIIVISLGVPSAADVRDAGRGAGGDRHDHDDRRVRAGRRHRQARRPRPGACAMPPRRCSRR